LACFGPSRRLDDEVKIEVKISPLSLSRGTNPMSPLIFKLAAR
jgi:hypothetical protein